MPNETPAATAEQATAANQAIIDQYDIGGDVAAVVTEPVEVARHSTETEPAAKEDSHLPPAAPSRPRNSDGTFAALPSESAPHSPRLVRMAADLGLSEQEIAATPVDRLDDLVYHLNRQALTLARERSSQDALLADTERKPAPAPAPVPEADDIDKLEGYEPQLIGLLKSQAAQLKELRAVVQQIQSVQQNNMTRNRTQRADRVFAQHEQIFGKGTFDDLAKDSPEFDRREAIADWVRKHAKEPGTIEAKINRAIKVLYPQAGVAAPSKPGKSAPNPPADETETDIEEQWRQAPLARPTNRVVTEPKGRNKAERAVAAWQKENGAAHGFDSVAESDDFPE